jgi:hypothetical protein
MGMRWWPLLTLAASGCTPPSIWDPHSRFLDRELQGQETLELTQVLEKSTRSLRRDDFRGWLAFSSVLINDRGEARWVNVWLEPANKMPGYSRVRSVVVNPEGRVVDDSIFLTGWRHLDFTGVSKVLRPKFPDVLRIGCEGLVIRNRRHFYALAGDRLELVRLEGDEPAKIQANFCTSPNHTIGPVYPPAGEEDCVQALQNASWTRRMSMLTWLAGIHWDGSNPNLWHEDEKAATLALNLQSSPRSLAAVKALAGAEDAWTREAVGLVLDRDR